LQTCNSEWVSYSVENTSKGNSIYAYGELDWLYVNLYTLSCLHVQGIEKPVVITYPY